MRCAYYIVVFVGVAAHYALINALDASCIPNYMWYAPIALFTLTIAVFRALVSRTPDGPPPVDEETCEQTPIVPMCKLCCAVSEAGTFHCKICHRCVVEFDHHCDILDICIGKGNINRFRFFLLYHVALCAYALYEHGRLMSCVSEIPNLLVFAPIVMEFSFGMACACFALFHMILLVSSTRTYDIIRWCRRPRGKKTIAPRKWD